MNIFDEPLILASQSLRRAQLLSLIGMRFSVIPSAVDESLHDEQDPEKHVLKLSLLKAEDVASRTPEGLVIGADTIVVLDGEILGKPKSSEKAYKMLKQLSGRTHYVYTGFSLVEMPGGRKVSDFEVTAVHFRDLFDWEIIRYIESENPLDKAGAYGIQDQSALFVDRIEGCYYNVVGFPITKFFTALINFKQKK